MLHQGPLLCIYICVLAPVNYSRLSQIPPQTTSVTAYPLLWNLSLALEPRHGLPEPAHVE
jgi:hypothetical protein